MRSRPEVLILGAGYAGLMAASRVLRSQLANVTIIDSSPRFEQRIRMHEVLAGRSVKSPKYSDWLPGKSVRMVVDRVCDIDPQSKQVITESGCYTYDYLLFALGSEVDQSAIPGASEFAVSIGRQAANAELSGKLRNLNNVQGKLVFIGAGLTNLESATELAETFPSLNITLISSGTLFEDFSVPGREYLWSACRRLNIELVEKRNVTRVLENSVQLDDGSRVEADLTVVAPGFRASKLGQKMASAWSEIMVDKKGRILCYPDLSASVDQTIWVAGDACHRTTEHQRLYRMGCALALPMGAQAGENIVRHIQGQVTEAFRFGYIFRCVSLGRKDALIQWTDERDVPREKITTGRRAVRIKEWICKLTYYAPKWELKTGIRCYYWPKPEPAALDATEWPYDAG